MSFANELNNNYKDKDGNKQMSTAEKAAVLPEWELYVNTIMAACREASYNSHETEGYIGFERIKDRYTFYTSRNDFIKSEKRLAKKAGRDRYLDKNGALEETRKKCEELGFESFDMKMVLVNASFLESFYTYYVKVNW